MGLSDFEKPVFDFFFISKKSGLSKKLKVSTLDIWIKRIHSKVPKLWVIIVLICPLVATATACKCVIRLNWIYYCNDCQDFFIAPYFDHSHLSLFSFNKFNWNIKIFKNGKLEHTNREN